MHSARWAKVDYPRLLFVFILFYPLVFFPGAIFYKPILMMPIVIDDASEQYLYLPKLLFLLVFGVLGILEIRRKRLGYAFVYLLLAHLGLAFASATNARDDWAFNLLGGQLRFDGLLYQIGLTMIGIFTFISLLENPKRLSAVTGALVIGGFIQSLIVLLQRFNLDPITPLRQYTDFNLPLGTIGHPGMVAALLLPALCVALWNSLQNNRQIGWLVGLVGISIGLGITGNSASFYALLAVLIGLNLQHRQKRLLLLSVAVLICILIPRSVLPNPQGFQQDYRDTTTLGERFILWKIALRSISETRFQPLIGGGIDALKLSQLRNPPLTELTQVLAIENSWPKDAKVKSIHIEEFPGGKLRDRWMVFEFSTFGGQENVRKEYRFGLDKAHNFLLDRWLAFGLLNALIWLVLYSYPIIQGIRSRDIALNFVGWTLLALFVYYSAWFPVMQVEPIHLALVATAWMMVTLSKTVSSQTNTAQKSSMFT